MTCDLSVCTMDHSDFIVCSCTENSIGLKLVLKGFIYPILSCVSCSPMTYILIFKTKVSKIYVYSNVIIYLLSMSLLNIFVKYVTSITILPFYILLST